MATNLHKALAAALGEIHRLKKDDKNDHGRYKYVSVDDVKDHVRPILAKHGLMVSVNETAFDIVAVSGKQGDTTSCKITYAITIKHTDGGELPPDRITILLPYTGAQTAGAARSYAVKEWAKGSLLVSTGEKDQIEGGADADAYKQQEYIAPRQEKTAHRAHKEDGDDFRRIQSGLQQISREGNLDDLALFWKNNRAAVAEMKADWKSSLTNLKDEIKKAFDLGSRRPFDQPTDEFDPETGEILEDDDPSTENK